MGIGSYSEAISSVLLEAWTSQGQIFRVVNIGGNYPTVDVYAEVQDNDRTYIALFQIKSTEKSITKKNTLPIQINKSKLNSLSMICAPTYLIGIEFNKSNPPLSRGFIKGIFGKYTKGIGSITTNYAVDNVNLINLRDEILNFWKNSNVQNNKRKFNSSFV